MPEHGRGALTTVQRARPLRDQAESTPHHLGSPAARVARHLQSSPAHGARVYQLVNKSAVEAPSSSYRPPASLESIEERSRFSPLAHALRNGLAGGNRDDVRDRPSTPPPPTVHAFAQHLHAHAQRHRAAPLSD